MIEVELKAWVDNTDHLNTALLEHAQFIRKYEKLDEYFSIEMSSPLGVYQQDVRIRIDDNNCYLTYKERKIIDNVEFNNEHELGIDNAATMREFLLKIGAKKLITKHKIGSAWKLGNFLIEFSLVKGLGYFIEVETLHPDDSMIDNEKIVLQLQAVLVQLGIPLERIEIRSYTSMLLELQDNVNVLLDS